MITFAQLLIVSVTCKVTEYAGNPITTSGGEEKAIVINAGATYTNTQVMPWGDFVSQQAQL